MWWFVSLTIAAAFVRHVAPKGWQCRGGEVHADRLVSVFYALWIVSGLGHIFVFKCFCLLGFLRLRSPDIEGVPLPRDVKDSLNVSTFFLFFRKDF